MGKKGFTLVELLAVIAILAILVIVAMPNVLGMFNQAKSSTFVTEVQSIMSQSSTKFVSESLKNPGKELVFYNNENESSTAKKEYNKLSMSGNEKNYFIKMNRKGEFEKVVVWDANFCYDSATGNITKEDVSVSLVHESISNDGVTWNGTYIEGTYTNASTFTIKGCEGTVDGVLYGDVDLDGFVTAADAQLASRYVAELIDLESKSKQAADVNLDGHVNGVDTTFIMLYVDGTITSLPIKR